MNSSHEQHETQVAYMFQPFIEIQHYYLESVVGLDDNLFQSFLRFYHSSVPAIKIDLLGNWVSTLREILGEGLEYDQRRHKEPNVFQPFLRF